MSPLLLRLNLSEFKAVLAHEFGHFSQNSMKLGSYVYMANRIIGDLVFGREWLDDLLATLRGVDLRIAIFAWAFTGVLWALRKGLQGAFRVINFASSALSREMEFNADLVAVSVTGSDALVHSLARLDFATEALGQAWTDLSAAADHRLYSRDLFYHQTRASEYLRALRKDAHRGEPPVLPKDPGQTMQVFEPEDTSTSRMWATHPSNHDREVNAKRHYVRSPLDEGSPWILFQDAPAVREAITRRVYQATGKPEGLTLEAPEVVQAFIDEEHAETTYHPRYHGFYDDRYLTPGDLEELLRAAPAEFADKVRMEAHRGRLEDYRRVAPLAHGAVELRGKDFPFRGSRYRAAEARRLLDQVKKELDEDFTWMGHRDRQVFLVYHALARQAGDEVRREFEERYRFHLALQAIPSEVSASRTHVDVCLSMVAGKARLSEAEFRGTVAALQLAYDALARNLEAAARLRLPALKNVTPGEPLGPVLMSRPLVPRLKADQNSLDGSWIGQFLQQLEEVLEKARRIHFKSLGGILTLQERLAAQGSTQGHCPAPPEPAVR